MDNILPENMHQHNLSHTKWCPACRAYIQFKDFSPSKTKDGLYGYCKNCSSNRFKDNSNPNKIRTRDLRRLYGITTQHYEQMLANQENVCNICKMPETRIDPKTGKARLLCVDHDHKTGDVRALLCNKCNTALGYMDEDPERIKSLLAYAEWCQVREPHRKIIQLPLMPDE